MNQAERRTFLIQSLLKERDEYRNMGIPTHETDQRALLRGLINVRPAWENDIVFLHVQDEYLREEIAGKGITDNTARDLSMARGYYNDPL